MQSFPTGPLYHKDGSLNFAKCMTSVSGARIADGSQPAYDISTSTGEGEQSPDSGVSSACAAHPAIMQRPTTPATGGNDHLAGPGGPTAVRCGRNLIASRTISRLMRPISIIPRFWNIREAFGVSSIASSPMKFAIGREIDHGT